MRNFFGIVKRSVTFNPSNQKKMDNNLISKRLKDISSKYTNISAGGCGVFAVELYERLKALNIGVEPHLWVLRSLVRWPSAMIIYLRSLIIKSNMSMKRNFLVVAIMLVVVVMFSGCADVSVVDKCVDVKEAYGFWSGLWHGLIAPFSFIGSLFSDDIAVYAVNNRGGWYDFGFLLGVGSLGFGSRSAVHSRH